MAVATSVIYDGAFQRRIQRGDTLAGAEVIPATIATNAITITGTQLASGLIQRTTTGAGTDTIDTAVNIINAINGGTGRPLQAGTTWRVSWVQTAAFTVTLEATANTGVSLVRPTVNASSSKEFLVTVVNGTPGATVVADTTSGSPVITGMNTEETVLLSAGMVVTNAVAGLQGSTILSVNPGVGITLSGNASSTASNVAINFSPIIKIEGIRQGPI